MARDQKGNQKVYPMFEKTDTGLNPLTPMGALVNLVRKAPSEKGKSVNNPQVGVNKQTLDRVSQHIIQDVVDNDAIMQLNPDLELVETVLTGNILSPKSLGETELAWSVDPVIFDSELSRVLMEPVELHFKRDYKINDRLDIQVKDILFRKGAVVTIVLPENVLDHLVNGSRKVSMEDFGNYRRRLVNGQPLGLLGHPTKVGVSLENWNQTTDNSNMIHGDKNLLVTDNFDILKSPNMGRTYREKRIADKLSKRRISLEAEMRQETENYAWTNADIEKLYQRNNQGNSEHAQVVTSPQYMERASVGHPLALQPPVESVIPVYMQGRPNEHIGYFLLVDQNGYPVSKENSRDFYGEMQTSWRSGGSGNGASEVLRMTRETLTGTDGSGAYEINDINRTYNSIVVNDLNNRLRNGEYDQELEIGLTEEVQRIMLYRNWASKCTQLVFIPAELCTYMAFNYSENGVGESLLTRSKMISTMRSTLLMADTIGGMRNAIGRKRVKIRLDPDDVDPEQSISNAQSIIMEQALRAFPLASPDPSQAMDALMRSGYDFEVDANGSAYAETQVQYEDYITNQTAGNPDLQDRLRRIHISSMGVHPEKVDPMSSPDFATTATHNDLVFSRRVRAYQKVLTDFLQKFVRCYTHHSSILRQQMAHAIMRNRKMMTPEQLAMPIDDIIDDFISAIQVSLPAPDNTQHERQLESYRAYTELLDLTLEAYITPDLFPDDTMGINGAAEKILTHVKAYFRRQFLTNNNIMAELGILLEMDGDKPAFSLLDYMAVSQSTMGRAFLEFLEQEAKNKKRFEAEYKSLMEAVNGSGDGAAGGEWAPPTDGAGEDPLADPNLEGGDLAGEGAASLDNATDGENENLTPNDEDSPTAMDGLDDPVGGAAADEALQ
jgi:hypothetical protein